MNNTQVRTTDGRIFFAASDALVLIYLAEVGNPKVEAVRMPSGVWSTKQTIVRYFN